MKFSKAIIPALIISVVSISGIVKLSNNKAIIDANANKTETLIAEIPVNTSKVTSILKEDKLTLVGTFSARKELTVIAETQGRITNIFVKEGQNITKGQSIASINDATMRSQLASAKSALTKSTKDVERYKNLLQVGAISQTQFEEVKLGMQNQQTNVTSLEQQLQYSTLKSPMNGTIKEVKLEEGSFANPGTQVATVVDITKLKMIVNLDELEIVKVKHGQKVNITTEVYPNIIFRGVVNQISVQADEARKYEIAIELDNNKVHPLKAGMYGNVIIPSINNATARVLTIPRKSVLGSIKNPQVYIAKDGIAKLVNIKVGQTINDMVEVLSGLNEKDVIITTGQINLDNGRAITIIK